MPVNVISWGEGEYAIAHLSDLHFGSPNDLEVWGLTVQCLLEIKPDLPLLAGDLVDTPLERLYEQVKSRLDSLRIPYYVCAGNHDRF
jgi:3',5'-cyclic AMP phosphodiesterase CpdA